MAFHVGEKIRCVKEPSPGSEFSVGSSYTVAVVVNGIAKQYVSVRGQEHPAMVSAEFFEPVPHDLKENQ